MNNFARWQQLITRCGSASLCSRSCSTETGGRRHSAFLVQVGRSLNNSKAISDCHCLKSSDRSSGSCVFKWGASHGGRSGWKFKQPQTLRSHIDPLNLPNCLLLTRRLGWWVSITSLFNIRLTFSKKLTVRPGNDHLGWITLQITRPDSRKSCQIAWGCVSYTSWVVNGPPIVNGMWVEQIT